jgi:hypothetical protein
MWQENMEELVAAWDGREGRATRSPTVEQIEALSEPVEESGANANPKDQTPAKLPRKSGVGSAADGHAAQPGSDNDRPAVPSTPVKP